MDTNLKNIYLNILEISEVELQKKYWLSGDPNHISSYYEVMCRLFDDNDFDGFIEEKTKQYKTPLTVIDELERLRVLLNEYEEKDTDEEIINDPEWHKVALQAKKIIKIWSNIL
jgi:hypothetical protein